MDVHQASISIAVSDAAGKVLMECIIETKATTVLEFIQGLRGSLWITFEEGTSAAWLYDLLKPRVTKVVVCNPRKNALLKAGNKNDRGGCTETKRPAARGTSHAGVPRRVRSPHTAGTGPQLSRRQQRSHARDESSQSDLSELGDSLRRPASLFPAPSRRLAGKTAGDRRAPPGRADLSTTRLSDGDTEGHAEGVAGGKPEASGPSAPRTDSPAGPDPGRPSDRSPPDTASFPHEATTLELLRAGLADAEQRRIPIQRGATAACAETTGAARSQR